VFKQWNVERVKYLNDAQLRGFFAAIEAERPKTPIKKTLKLRDLLLFEMMYFYGLREGEAVRLKLADLISDKRQVFVQRLKRRGQEGRAYDIPDEIARLLKRWLKERQMFPSAGENPYLFIGQKARDGHLAEDLVYGLFKKYALRAGLAGYSPHSLRHACAVQLARKGHSAFAIRDYLGHATVLSTQGYVELHGPERRERDKAIAETLKI
jgi:integrase/recombinase XerD